MPATPQDRLYGLTTSVAVKPPVFISADYHITCFGEQTITSKTPTDERTITTTEGMRILLLGQDNPVENGIWVARRSFWVRAPDFNGARDAVNGTLVFSITGDCWQVEAVDPVVIGLSAIHFRPTYPFEANLDIFQRTLRVPEASVSVLPSAADRAWKGLGFDGAGQPKLQDPAGTGLWGYVPAIGSFEKGSIITERFQVLLWESTNEYWRWDGSPFPPKIVLPGSTPDTAGGRGKGKWLDVTDATLRSNLGSDEEGLGSWLVNGNAYFSVHEILSRVRTLADAGIPRPVLGYDSDNDKLLYKAMQEMGDQELLLAGGIHISKKFRSLRRNNNLLGLRGGLTGTAGAFNDQIMGVSNSLDLAKYGTHDGVSHFMDATLPPLEEWETVAGVFSYSANSVVVDTATYSDLLSNLLRGDILKTMHSTPCWALVESIDKETGVITVKPWATSAAYVTPSGTTGFHANKIDKVWTFNANVIIPEDAAGNYAVIGELGAQIKKLGLSYVNGLDVTLLPGSIADGTAAYLSRSGVTNKTWTYGFRSEGSRFGFYSASGNVQPYSGFTERSNAVVGMRFHNQNTYSMVWGTGAVDSVAPVDSPTIFGPNGHVFRQPKRVLVLTESAIISSLFTDFIVKTAGITITMPPVENLPTAGYEFVLDLMVAGTYYIKAYNTETQVSGFTTYTLTTTVARKKYTVLWDGTYWQILEG